MKTQFQNPSSATVSPGFQAEGGRTDQQSDAARWRLLSIRSEPLFIADWERVLMMHYEVDAPVLQREVPFELDLNEGRAYVTLVAFTMRGMRPRFGGKLSAWLVKPISTHHFLNVRTYVRHEGEAGIYFMREWLSNRLSVTLGPHTFGLPYRFAKIDYAYAERGEFIGSVSDGRKGGLAFRAGWDATKGYQ